MFYVVQGSKNHFGSGVDLPGKVIDVAPDGNCFFHAVAQECVRKGINDWTHERLRAEAIVYLQAHPELLQSPSELDGREVSKEDYLTAMAKVGTYAEGPIIDATALCLNAHLSISNLILNNRGEYDIFPLHINDHDGIPRPTIGLVRQGQHYKVLKLFDYSLGLPMPALAMADESRKKSQQTPAVQGQRMRDIVAAMTHPEIFPYETNMAMTISQMFILTCGRNAWLFQHYVISFGLDIEKMYLAFVIEHLRQFYRLPPALKAQLCELDKPPSFPKAAMMVALYAIVESQESSDAFTVAQAVAAKLPLSKLQELYAGIKAYKSTVLRPVDTVEPLNMASQVSKALAEKVSLPGEQDEETTVLRALLLSIGPDQEARVQLLLAPEFDVSKHYQKLKRLLALAIWNNQKIFTLLRMNLQLLIPDAYPCSEAIKGIADFLDVFAKLDKTPAFLIRKMTEYWNLEALLKLEEDIRYFIDPKHHWSALAIWFYNPENFSRLLTNSNRFMPESYQVIVQILKLRHKLMQEGRDHPHEFAKRAKSEIPLTSQGLLWLLRDFTEVLYNPEFVQRGVVKDDKHLEYALNIFNILARTNSDTKHCKSPVRYVDAVALKLIIEIYDSVDRKAPNPSLKLLAFVNDICGKYSPQRLERISASLAAYFEVTEMLLKKMRERGLTRAGDLFNTSRVLGQDTTAKEQLNALQH